jgi:hypothetical protein
MALSVFPAAAGGGIKLVQRGQAVSSGNITITAVDPAKSFVTTFSEGSSGTVALNSSETGTLNPSGGAIQQVAFSGQPNGNAGSFASYSGTRTLSSGTMNATVKVIGAYLSNSTTLVTTGACRWEVVEFA